MWMFLNYEYNDTIKFDDPKLRLVSDKDGRLFVRKNTHVDSMLAEKLTGISCPRIVKFIEFGEDDEGEYVIEEYIEGTSAAERTFTPKQAVKALIGLCDALEALHSAKIVHRDIKPSNIIVTPDGDIKLIDFDASRIEKIVKDKDTQILGTEGFAPPEQFGFSQTDSRSDIYSFGVTMNIILGENSAPFAKIIKKCKALDPNDRYDSISKVKAAIRLATLKRFAAIPAAALLMIAFTVVLSVVLNHRVPADNTVFPFSENSTGLSASSDTAQSVSVDPQSESSDPPRTSDELPTSQSPESSQSSELPLSSGQTQSSEQTQSSDPPQSSEQPQTPDSSQTQTSQASQTSEPVEVDQPPETSNGFYKTVKNEYGYYSDVCDYVFYDDPSVHGEWKVIGLINKNDISYFLNGRTDPVYYAEDAWIQSLSINADGTAVANDDWNSAWTNGYIILDNTYCRTIDELYAVNIDGVEYLLMENKTGDYMAQGLVNSYFIFTRTGKIEFSFSTYINDNGLYEDKCSYWFTDDPKLHGTWKIAGLVKTERYEQWLNGKTNMTPTDYAWLNKIEFCPDGSAILNNNEMQWLWTSGYLVRDSNTKGTVSALSIVNVNGTEYLTIENKNGDYSRLGRCLSYCIFTREAG